jgi:hypothetical protein
MREKRRRCRSDPAGGSPASGDPTATPRAGEVLCSDPRRPCGDLMGGESRCGPAPPVDDASCVALRCQGGACCELLEVRTYSYAYDYTETLGWQWCECTEFDGDSCIQVPWCGERVRHVFNRVLTTVRRCGCQISYTSIYMAPEMSREERTCGSCCNPSCYSCVGTEECGACEVNPGRALATPIDRWIECMMANCPGPCCPTG